VMMKILIIRACAKIREVLATHIDLPPRSRILAAGRKSRLSR
jgi:hypothetical protein